MFLSYVHSFRAIAILFVVAGHSIWILQWPVDSVMCNALADGLENGTVMFVFVAGFLFHHLSKRFQYKDYLGKKFKNVILPYLLIATPASVEGALNPHFYLRYPEIAGTPVVYRFFWFMIKGGASSNKALWFIPMITIIYLAAPIFMQFVNRPRLYLLLVALVPLSLLAHRDASPNLDTLGLTLYYLPAYLLGMWTSQYRTRVEPYLDRFWVWLLVAWTAMYVAMVVIAQHHGNYEGDHLFSDEHGLIDWLFAQKLLLTFALLGLIRRFEQALAKPLDGLAESSFTIFFLHCYILDIIVTVAGVLSGLFGYPLLAGSITTWFTCFIIAAGASYGIALATRRLFGVRSRYLIGS